jgi:hypothetical protein
MTVVLDDLRALAALRGLDTLLLVGIIFFFYELLKILFQRQQLRPQSIINFY